MLEGWLRFAERYGWRAYAVPVLALLTLLALLAPLAPPAASTAAGRVTVEGRDGSGYAAAFTPVGVRVAAPPVTIDLADDSDVCTGNDYAKLVLVDLSRQHLWACSGRREVRDTAVTTGAAGDATPTGSWRVQAKQRKRYLVGPGYRDYVQYWMPFNGDFGLHDASWQTMPFGSADYRKGGSHGCVHTPTAVMAWLYDWAKVGRTVVTVRR